MIRRSRNGKGQFTSDVVSIFIEDGKKYKICTMCKEKKSIDCFYYIKNRDITTSRCKKCTNKITKKYSYKYKEYYINYWKTHKDQAAIRSRKYIQKKNKEWIDFISEHIEIKCKKCGYNKLFAAMDFHHLNPEEKEYEIHSLFKKRLNEKTKNIFLKELKKCILVCATCHREIHNETNTLSN